MHICPAIAVLLGLVAGCTTVPADGSTEIQTSSAANRESLQSAAASPLRDMNVLKTKIPYVLIDAMANPYARPQPLSCSRLLDLLIPLDGALGADLDQPARDEDDLVTRGRGAALGAVAGAASGIIPFRGWVRKLSGAERHDGLVTSAINAGAIRRAYLKGLGEAKGCRPPAAPTHGAWIPPPPVQTGRARYPIR